MASRTLTWWCQVTLVTIIVCAWTTVKCEIAANSKENAVISSDPHKDRDLVCPDLATRNLPIFTLSCQTDKDCSILGEQCCLERGSNRCRKGVPKPKPPRVHAPLLGVLPRECPVDPVTEVLAVRNCTEDRDCWPRLCCPDGFNSYCRTSAPKWDKLPRLAPLKSMIAYLQCTPPPPPLFDLFPKPCRSTVDCFPNLCCQEQHRKICRPPKKSLLALIAQVAQV